jgi:(p)ppGpp synthase/HD superfamily hydrolase
VTSSTYFWAAKDNACTSMCLTMKNTAAVLQIKLADSLQNMIKNSMVFAMPKN